MKHYILAKTRGMCMTLNLTGEACVTLIPDNSDNMTNVIRALEKIQDAFGPSESAGFSFNRWLNDQFSPWGSMIVHILIPVLIVFGITLCFCTCALTCMRALMYRWISGVVGGENTSLYVKIPLQLTNESRTELYSISEWAPGNPYSDSNDELV